MKTYCCLVRKRGVESNMGYSLNSLKGLYTLITTSLMLLTMITILIALLIMFAISIITTLLTVATCM